MTVLVGGDGMIYLKLLSYEFFLKERSREANSGNMFASHPMLLITLNFGFWDALFLEVE